MEQRIILADEMRKIYADAEKGRIERAENFICDEIMPMLEQSAKQGIREIEIAIPDTAHLITSIMAGYGYTVETRAHWGIDSAVINVRF